MSKLPPLQRFWYNVVWDTRTNLEDPNTPINGVAVSELFGGTSKTASGQTVTADSALTQSTVFACVRIISGVIGYLPLKLYKKTDEGREVVSNSLSRIIGKRPYAFMTKPVYFERAVYHMLFWGNHYAEILHDHTGRFAGLRIIHPSAFKGIKEIEGILLYRFQEQGDEYILPMSMVIHVPHLGDKIVGESVIGNAKASIGLDLAAEEYGSKFFAGGGRPTGVISTEQVIPIDQLAKIRDLYREQKNTGTDIVLMRGFQYNPVTVPPNDMQFIETRKGSIADIARFFGVPMNKLNEMERAYASLEQNDIGFINDTLLPIINKIEYEYTDKLVTDNEMYFEHNVEAYLRADSKTKAEMYRTGIQNGYKTINEVRSLNNDPKIPDGDTNWIQMNMMPVDMAREVIGRMGQGNPAQDPAQEPDKKDESKQKEDE